MPETAPEAAPELMPETAPETAVEAAVETAETGVEASVAEAADGNQADLHDAVDAEGDVAVETEVMEMAPAVATEDDNRTMAGIPANQETITETVTDVEMEEPAVAADTPGELTPAEHAQDGMQQHQEAMEEQVSPESAQDSADEPETETGPYQLLAAAREAYWLRDYELAEGQYRKLIELQPDNPDGYGELGNMYFSQGSWEEAASAYYEAGTRLLKDGLLVQAQQLVDVIRGLNGSQADDLAKQVDAAQAESH